MPIIPVQMLRLLLQEHDLTAAPMVTAVVQLCAAAVVADFILQVLLIAIQYLVQQDSDKVERALFTQDIKQEVLVVVQPPLTPVHVIYIPVQGVVTAAVEELPPAVVFIQDQRVVLTMAEQAKII